MGIPGHIPATKALEDARNNIIERRARDERLLELLDKGELRVKWIQGPFYIPGPDAE